MGERYHIELKGMETERNNETGVEEKGEQVVMSRSSSLYPASASCVESIVDWLIRLASIIARLDPHRLPPDNQHLTQLSVLWSESRKTNWLLFSSFLSRPLDVISFPLQQIFSSNRTTIGRINTNNVASVVWLLAFSSRVEAGEREGKAVHKNKWINFSIHYDDALSSVDLFLLTRCRK